MRRISLVHWAKVLLGAAVIVTGCDDIEGAEQLDDYELRDEAQAETLGAPESLAPPEVAESDVFEQIEGNDEDADPDANVIPGHYIVMMKQGADGKAAAAAVQAAPNHVYTQVMSGFAGKLNANQLGKLKKHKDVLLIEPDQYVSIADAECPDYYPKRYTQTKSQGMPYGLDRIDQANQPLSGTYTYSWDGDGVNVYVFDTGIYTKHSEFEGRAKATYDAFLKKSSNKYGQDCHGHGTHVAGTIGGKTYGVAKDVTLHAVRVLDCNGNGTWSRMIAAMDWVANNARHPAVANMSLSGGASSLVDAAVKRLVDSGVVVVVAAGNKNTDACKYSPARAPSALTIAANNSNDVKADFSNYGSCVDMYAPGTNIRSAWLNNATAVASGTSMATPHVAGVAALYFDAIDGSASPYEVEDDLEDWAGVGKISGNPSNTDNLLVRWPCGGN
jgi:subtilisin family serine protease